MATIALEDKIRDKLAADLSVLEDGLTLVQKEFPLENLFGADARLDILARDVFGSYVIIEVKRSNQAARQAIHELFKYASIIHRQLGVTQNQIRAILVSTTWHELAVPFAEYLQSTQFQTQGFAITVDAAGGIIAADRFTPPHLTSPLKISATQSILLYSSKHARDLAFPAVSAQLVELGVDDHLLLAADFNGDDPRVIFPNGIYIGFSSPFYTLNLNDSQTLKEKLNWDSELFNPDENFLIALHAESHGQDDTEIGTPEKLRAMSESWAISIAKRNGRFKSNERIVSDRELINQLMQTEGGSGTYLHCIASPRLTQRWQKLIDDIALVALGNQRWSKTIPAILNEIANRNNSAVVSVSIYSLADTPMSIAQLCWGDPRYLPSFEIVSKEGQDVWVYVSRLCWNEKPLTILAQDFFGVVYGDLWNWATARHFGEQFQYDDQAMSILGLSTPVWSIHFPENGTRTIHVLDNAPNHKPISELPEQMLFEMISKNVRFFSEYLALLEAVGFGSETVTGNDRALPSR